MTQFTKAARVALVACAIATVAGLATAVLPRTADYMTGFAPPWVMVLSATVGALALVRSRLTVLGWTAVALLLWSAGGIVFDVLRVLAVLGVPGMPAVVDWPGMVSRSAALAAAGSLVAVLVARPVAGRPADRTSRPSAGYVASLLTLPYPMLKLYWWFGGDLARSAIGSRSVEGVPIGEVAVFGLAMALGFLLAHRWGRRLPSWLLLIGGWSATGILLTMGALAGFGTLAEITGLTDGPARFGGDSWVVSVVYGSWLLLGLAFGRATIDYQRGTRAGEARPALNTPA
jgi:hypothetical protein